MHSQPSNSNPQIHQNEKVGPNGQFLFLPSQDGDITSSFNQSVDEEHQLIKGAIKPFRDPTDELFSPLDNISENEQKVDPHVNLKSPVPPVGIGNPQLYNNRGNFNPLKMLARTATMYRESMTSDVNPAQLDSSQAIFSVQKPIQDRGPKKRVRRNDRIRHKKRIEQAEKEGINDPNQLMTSSYMMKNQQESWVL